MQVLDTSALIAIARGTKTGERIRLAVAGKTVAITSISYYEFIRGAKEHEAEKFIEAYEVIGFGKKAAQESGEIFQSLRRNGISITPLDVLIAGICRANGATLHSLDKDFQRILGFDVKTY